jgi:ribosomal protein L37AE/L43A
MLRIYDYKFYCPVCEALLGLETESENLDKCCKCGREVACEEIQAQRIAIKMERERFAKIEQRHHRHKGALIAIIAFIMSWIYYSK